MHQENYVKFKIGDIIKSRYDRKYDGHLVYEVMEIHTQECYGGTQVFYWVAPIIIRKAYKGGFNIERATPRVTENYRKLRADEVENISEEVYKILHNIED